MVVLNQRPTSSKFNYETILFIKEMNSTRMTRRKTITFMFYLYKCTMCFFFFFLRKSVNTNMYKAFSSINYVRNDSQPRVENGP